MESRENRFHHLLQPIRELTKNWDIDVASELNDYLEELDEIELTFDGGQIKLNFAEAALLIQGSTHIYSKKVELLYKLVFNTLDYINDRNKKRAKQAAGSPEDAEDESRSTTDEDEGDVFVHLDSTTAVDKGLIPSDSTMSVHVVPLPPESLILPETHEKQKLPLISVHGEILASQKDFRINTFIPGNEDFILLTLGSAHGSAGIEHTMLTDFSLPQQQDAVPEAAVDAGEGVVNVHDGGDDDGEDHFLPIQTVNDVEMDAGPDEHIDRQRASTSEGRKLRVRPAIDADKLKWEEEAHTVDVWKLQDPYAVRSEDKPLKTGKSFKVPGGLDEGGKRKRKGPSPLQDFDSWMMGEYDPPDHKLKNGPTFTDLNHIYVANIKAKLKTRKRTLRKAGLVVSDEELMNTYLQPEVEPLQQPHLQGEDNSDNEDELFPDDIPADLGGGPDFITPEAQRDALSYEDLVKQSVEQFLLASRGYAQETDLSRRVKDWEDKIRPELDIQEERPVCDIRDYGDRIVAALDSVGSRRSFASIVHGLDNFEACKYMLASLQLANDHTVELDSAEGLEESLDTVALTLLSTDKATDRFKRLQASDENAT